MEAPAGELVEVATAASADQPLTGPIRSVPPPVKVALTDATAGDV
jgi:hypothetical protein